MSWMFKLPSVSSLLLAWPGMIAACRLVVLVMFCGLINLVLAFDSRTFHGKSWRKILARAALNSRLLLVQVRSLERFSWIEVLCSVPAL